MFQEQGASEASLGGRRLSPGGGGQDGPRRLGRQQEVDFECSTSPQPRPPGVHR